MKEVFNRYERENSTKSNDNEDSATTDDKILADDDFGSIYVSDETFLKLMEELKKRHEPN